MNSLSTRSFSVVVLLMVMLLSGCSSFNDQVSQLETVADTAVNLSPLFPPNTTQNAPTFLSEPAAALASLNRLLSRPTY